MRPVDPRIRASFVKSGVFDRAWYLIHNPDVQASGEDPVEHYLTTGWREGREPGPLFDSAHYLSQLNDRRESDEAPALHYVLMGWRRGLSPRPGYSPPATAHLLPDVCPVTLERASSVRVPARAYATRSRRWPDVPSLLDNPAVEPPACQPLRTVAFYLPQFHPIPENDAWWGEGFTEWTNVRRSEPRYPGHDQPRVPGDLGFYDLRDTEVMRRQVALAKLHGVSAFCFYAYWFAGKRLLEKPLDLWLANADLDLEFMVCWANENWTRTWDGEDAQVLIAQDHSPADDLAFIAEMAPYLRDPRYVRINGRPVLLVYRPQLLPDPAATADRWRQWCRDHGIGEIILASTESFGRGDPRRFGFDFAVEFPPNNTAPVDVTDRYAAESSFEGVVYDLAELAGRSRALTEPDYPLWRGVCPSWDNDARRPGKGTVFHGGDPRLFAEWLTNVGRDTVARFPDPEARLVFINAWNEWAEGAYLEPDRSHGYQWLHAVRDAQQAVGGVGSGTGPGVVVVAHDLAQHGAQLLSLAMVSNLVSLGRRVEAVALEDGPLADAFRSHGPLHVVDDRDRAAVSALVEDLWDRGIRTALCNSSVTGFFAAALQDRGFHVVGMVHELPGILADPRREERARTMAAAADRLIFPAEIVREKFPFPVSDGTEVVIRPQGLYTHVSPPQTADPRAGLRSYLAIPSTSRIVVGIGYADRRKGFDLLLDAVGRLNGDEAGDPVHLVWLGRVDTQDPAIARSLAAFPADRLHTPGFVSDLGPYLWGSDALALSSREDPFPSVSLEALVAGLPIVAFQGCTGQDVLVSESHGVLVGEVTAEALAAGLDEALAQEDPTGATKRLRRSMVRHEFHFRRYVMDILAGTPAEIPRVSVVIPNYNYGHLIDDRIGQVVKQTWPIYEVLVFDDASDDGSPAKVEIALDRYLEVAAKQFVNERNSGSVFAQWQAGVEHSTGDFVWVAEADDLADPDFLAEVMPAFMDPGVVLSYCESSQVDEDGVLLTGDYRAWTDLGVRDYSRRYVIEGSKEIADCLAVKNTIPNVSAVVMRRGPLLEALRELPREQFRTAGDWWVYVTVLMSGRLAYSPHAKNRHRRHSGSVIATGLGRSHLDEIEALQKYAASVVPLEDATIDKASATLREIADYLGLDPAGAGLR